MQRLINQRAKLTVEFTAKLFWVISIIASVMHAKNRIGFATDCKSDPVFCVCMTIASMMKISPKEAGGKFD